MKKEERGFIAFSGKCEYKEKGACTEYRIKRGRYICSFEVCRLFKNGIYKNIEAAMSC